MEEKGINKELYAQIALNNRLHLAYQTLPDNQKDKGGYEYRASLFGDTLLLNTVTDLINHTKATQTCKKEVIRCFKTLFTTGTVDGPVQPGFDYEEKLNIALDLSNERSPGLFNEERAGQIEEQLLRMLQFEIQNPEMNAHTRLFAKSRESKFDLWKKEFIKTYGREPEL